MPITLDGTLGITTPALTVTGATVNTGGISTAGNLTFTSTGNRITGDFSNATLTNRVAFQTSTTNGNTALQILPNGTSVTSTLLQFNNANPTNAAYGGIQVNSSTAAILSGITGTGTYLPMTFSTGGSERMRIDTAGYVGIGTSSPISPLTVASSSTITVGTPSVILQGGNNTERIAVYASGGAGAGTAAFLVASTRGTIASPTAVQANDSLGYYQLGGYNGANYIRGAWISGFADGNWSGSNQGSIITFANTPNGSTTITERMRITSAGNIGIGSQAAYGQLTINLAGQSDGANATTFPSIQINQASSGINTNGGIDFRGSAFGNGYGWRISAIDSSGVHLAFGNRQNATTYTEAMRIDYLNNVLIGRTSLPSNSGKLNVNGTIAWGTVGSARIYSDANWGCLIQADTVAPALAAFAFLSNNGTNLAYFNIQLGTGALYSNGGVITNTNPSDARLKESVKDLDFGLAFILKLRPVSYKWVDDRASQSTQYGFIAQDVQKIKPELVREFEHTIGMDSDSPEKVTRLGLEEKGISTALVKAIQEQQEIIEQLTSRLNALESK